MSHDPPPVSEIEVTPEMIDAGAAMYAAFDPGDRLDWMLESLYRAMTNAMTSRPVPPQRKPSGSLPLGQLAVRAQSNSRDLP